MSDLPTPSALPISRDADGRFLNGGPGRPPGARNRSSQRLILEILRDFELNRELVFHRLRAQNLNAYVSLVKSIMPSRGWIGAAEAISTTSPLPGDDTQWRAAECEKSDAVLRATLTRQQRLFSPGERKIG